ncbi:hypothetical protein N1851_027917 [Merluccius polli]|uniref:Uncharacterized protein n=1 Tax=Merluccius polli TaxID=89951 RepID=A0AA47M9R9_MERPO|nr:hypothetical protein N1851_027917 [Merluccius polli]
MYATVDTTQTTTEAMDVNVPSAELAAKAQNEPILTMEDSGRVVSKVQANESDQVQRTKSSSVEPALVKEEPHTPVIARDQVDTALGEAAKRKDLDVVAQSAFTESLQTKEEPEMTISGLSLCQTETTVEEPRQLVATRRKARTNVEVSKAMTHADVKPAQSTADSESPQTSSIREEQAALSNSQSTSIHEFVEPSSVKKVALVVLDIAAVQTVDTCPQTSSSERADSAGRIGVVPVPLGHASKESEPLVLPQSQINVPQSLLFEVQQPEVPKPEPTEQIKAFQVQVSATAPVAVKTEQVQIKPKTEKSIITPDSITGLAERGVVEGAMVVPTRTKSKPAGSPMMCGIPAQSKQDSEGHLSSVAPVEQSLPVPSRKRQSPKVARTTAKQPAKTTIPTTKAKVEKTKQDSSIVEPSKNQDSNPVSTAKIDVGDSQIVPSRRRSRETPEDSTASEPASDVAVPSDVQTEPIQAESETTAVEQTKLVPTTRKSKTSVSSSKLDTEPEQKITRSKPGINTVALDQAKPSPPTRRSKSTKTSEPIKTKTIHKEVIAVHTKQDPASLKSLINTESVTRASITAVVEDIKIEPTDHLEVSTSSEPTSHVTGPVDVKTEHFQTQSESVKSPITPEAITGLTATVVMEGAIVVPARRKLKPDGSPMTNTDVKPAQSKEDYESPQPSPIREETTTLTNEQSNSVKKVAVIVLDIPAFQGVDTCPQTSNLKRADSASSIGVDVPLRQASKQTKAQANVTAHVDVKTKQVQTKPESEKSLITPDSISGLSETEVVEEAMVVPARTKSKSAGSSMMHGKPTQSKQDSEGPCSSVAAVEQVLPVSSRQRQSPKVDRTAKQPAKNTIKTKVKTKIIKQDLPIVEPSKNQDLTPVVTAKVDVGDSHLMPSRRRSREAPEDSTASEPVSDVAVPADVPTKLAESETTADEQTKLVPTRRKSKTSVSSVKLDTEPEQKARSKLGMETVAPEQVKPSPPTRTSKSTKTSKPIKTDTIRKEVITVHTKQDPASLKSLINPESVTRPSLTAVVKETKMKPTGNKDHLEVSTSSEPTLHVTGPADVKIEHFQTKPESVKSPTTPESITGLTATGFVVEEAIVVPARRKFKPDGCPMIHADVKPAKSKEDSESPQPSPIREDQAALSISQSTTFHTIIEPHSAKKVALVVLDIPAVQTGDTCPLPFSPEIADSAGSIGGDITLGQVSVLPQSQINVPQSLLPEEQRTEFPKPEPTHQTKILQDQASLTSPVAVKTEQVQTKPESEKLAITPDSIPGLAETGVVEEAMVLPARTKSKPAGSPMMRANAKPAQSKQDSEGPLSSVAPVEQSLPVPSRKRQSPKVDRTTAKQPAKTTITTTKTKMEKTKQDSTIVEPSKNQDSTPVGTAKVDVGDSYHVPSRRRSRETPEDSTASEPASDVAVPADVQTEPVRAESETTAIEQTKLVPTRRTSKTSVSSVKLDTEPEQKACSKPGMERVALEQAKPSPPTRRSKSTKTSETFKKDTIHKEVITVHTKQDPASLTLINPESVTRESITAVVEETKKEPTVNKDHLEVSSSSEPTSHVTGPADVKTKPESVKSPITPESITGVAGTGVVEEAIVVPARRKLKPDGSPMTHADVKTAQSTEDSGSPQPLPIREEQAALSNSQSITVHQIVEPYSVKKVALVVLDIPAVQTGDTCRKTSSSESANSAGSIEVDITLGQASKESEPSVHQLPQSQINVPQSLLPEGQCPDVPKLEPTDQTPALQAQASVIAPAVVKTEQFQTKHGSEKYFIDPDLNTGLLEMGVVEEAMVAPARRKPKPAGFPMMSANVKPAQSKQDSEGPLSSIAAVEQALPGKRQSPKVDRTTPKQQLKTTITTTKAKTEKTKQDLSSVEPSKNKDSTPVGTAKVDVGDSHLVPSRRRSRETPEKSTASEPALDVAVPADVQTKHIQESTAVKQTKLVPTRRKSQTSVSSMKHDHTELEKMESSKPEMTTVESESPMASSVSGLQKSGSKTTDVKTLRMESLTGKTTVVEESLHVPMRKKSTTTSADVQTKSDTNTVEKTKLVPPTRRTSKTSMKPADTEPQLTKDSEHLQSLLSSKPDIKSDTVAKPSPPLRKLKSPKLARSSAPLRTANNTSDVFTVEPKEVSDLMSLECCISRESVTMETITAVVEEALLVPTRRKSQTALSSVEADDVHQQQQKDSECVMSLQSPRSGIKPATMEKGPKFPTPSEPGTTDIDDVEPEQTQIEAGSLDSSIKLHKSIPILTKTAGVVGASSVPTREEPLTSEPEKTQEEPEIPKSFLTAVEKETQAILTGRKSPGDSTAAVAHDNTTDAKVESGAHSGSTNEEPVFLQSSQTFEAVVELKEESVTTVVDRKEHLLISGKPESPESITSESTTAVTVITEQSQKDPVSVESSIESLTGQIVTFVIEQSIQSYLTSQAQTEVSNDEINLVPSSMNSILELSSILQPIDVQQVPTETQIVITGQTLPLTTNAKSKSPEHVTTSKTLSSSAETIGHLKPGEIMDLERPAKITMNLEEATEGKVTTEHSVVHSPACDYRDGPNVQQRVGSTKEIETIVEVDISPISEQSCVQSSIQIQVVDPVASPTDQQDLASVVSLIITDSVMGPSITAVVEETQVVASETRQSLEVSPTSEVGVIGAKPGMLVHQMISDTDTEEHTIISEAVNSQVGIESDQTCKQMVSMSKELTNVDIEPKEDGSQITMTESQEGSPAANSKGHVVTGVPAEKQKMDSEIRDIDTKAGIVVDQVISDIGTEEHKTTSETINKHSVDADQTFNQCQIVSESKKLTMGDGKPKADGSEITRPESLEESTAALSEAQAKAGIHVDPSISDTEVLKRTDQELTNVDIKPKEDDEQETLLSVATATTLDQAQVASAVQVQVRCLC